ncbi:SUMF1/EgtB/PvdO family nonheme iron enzyme [uncultured Desulfosarcina sp.]|uniref:formylglycine-generating enzyme family protein n=1 Tax=uncultured Desulfosarcina sp. TaxID=218289 RepID=UPI0029C6561F|nr:SUMF1/EgtB/PvdO family nonheme iron enzyme [uncultured Desulfosarcina sp.]
MKSKAIMDQLNRLAGCVQDREFDQARSLSRTIFNNLLKSVYALVRGQASAAIMRGLLELEIEIGGENSEFRDFASGQLIDLFSRGNVIRHMEMEMAPGPNLSTALDFQVIARWLEAGANDDGFPRPASLRFVHAWLTLLAEETGLLDSDEEVTAAPRIISKTAGKKVAEFPDEGSPFTDPVTDMTFVFVPGSTFSMGDTFNEGVEDEKPVHEVSLSDFYMATCPVTQAQWKRLMAENPSNFSGDDHPVEQVTLVDVINFIDKLNAASGTGLHFDLPSEAQWEYAARSGGKNELYAGGQSPEAVAWFEDDNLGGTAPVAQKTPNKIGLYDMSGNVWEWCRDIYHPEAYRRHTKNDPVCTGGSTDRVIRGGSWNLDAWSARCSRRFRFDPDLFGPALGFRVMMRMDG